MFMSKIKAVSTFLLVVFISFSTLDFCYADEKISTSTDDEATPTFSITEREARAIISRLIGVTDNMVESDIADNVKKYIQGSQIEAFYKEEYNYDNLLYNALSQFDTLIRSNGYSCVEALGTNSGNVADNMDFMRPALLLQGIISNKDSMVLLGRVNLHTFTTEYNNSSNYFYVMARQYGYTMSNDFDEIDDFYRSPITEKSLKHMVYAFLDSPVTYYYDEDKFLNGNTDPIHVTGKKITYFDLLKKEFSLTTKEAIYDYVTSIVRTDNVKRIDMVKAINSKIGYSDAKYAEIQSEINANVKSVYRDRSADVSAEDSKQVRYAIYYYLNGNYPMVSDYIKAEDYDDGFSLVERPGSPGITIKAQEYVKVSELKECLTNYITKQNITPKKSLDEIFGDMDMDSILKKSDLERITNEFAESIGVNSRQN